MVRPQIKILWHGEDNSAGNSERRKKERKTEGKRWEDNIKKWTGMTSGYSLRAAEDREGGEVLLQRHVVPRPPPRLSD